ncbi:MAG: Pvc16 family protein [bacterium]
MNDEAIGDITLAIKKLLEQELGNDNMVSLNPPWEDLGSGSDNNKSQGVNLFLYRVEENPHCKNMEWLGDPHNPKKIPASALSLDLFYLLTPFITNPNSSTDDPAFAHKVLGKAMRILHSNPVLNDIHNPYFDADNDMHFPENLRNSFEKIEVSLNPMNMEEMSKIWSMGNNPYKLSVAYHVSLVQIAPAPPVKPTAPLVQKTGIQEPAIIAPPMITQLSPASGPVGTKLQITGVNLSPEGFSPKVKMNETSITDLENATQNEIVLKVPEDVKRGPLQNIKVSINGKESNAKQFRITPWISSIEPQRGAVDKEDPAALTIDINGYDLQGDVQLKIGDVAVDPTEVSESEISAHVPHTLQNGHHYIDLRINETPTNKRTFEIVPLIKKFEPTQGKAGDSIEIIGQRLQGARISICIGPSVIIIGNNPNNSRITFNVPKRLSPGDYEVKIIVDGHESDPTPFKVIE